MGVRICSEIRTYQIEPISNNTAFLVSYSF
jgi:hypothetical protein